MPREVKRDDGTNERQRNIENNHDHAAPITQEEEHHEPGKPGPERGHRARAGQRTGRIIVAEDNADMRLTEIGRELGVVDDVRRQSEREFTPEGAIVALESLAGVAYAF